MKKQSEAEWLSDMAFTLTAKYGSIYGIANCRRLLAALKRCGWTSPNLRDRQLPPSPRRPETSRLDVTEKREGEEMKPPLRLSDICTLVIKDSENKTVCVATESEDDRYIVAAVNACHAAGLTVEQLEGGDVIAAAVAAEREAIAKLVEDDPNSCETCGLGGPPDWRAEWIAETIRRRATPPDSATP